MTGIKFWLRKVTKTWRQLLVTGGTVLAIGACGPGLDSLGPFSIGGEITGLTGTDRVVLQNNGGDDLTFTGSGSFTFSTFVPTDGAYVVTVRTQPTGMVCTVSNGSGTAKADVTTTSVQCGAPWTGTKQLGVAGEVTQGLSVAVDASGNVYVAGYTTGALSTNPAGQANTLTGNTDFFVTKIDIGGNVKFTQQLGAPGADTYGNAVALDSSGNVYVAGGTSGSLDTNQLAGTSDFFVTKYNSNGVKQHTQQSGFTGKEYFGRAVAIEPSGNLYVAGDVYDGVVTSGFFVTKYDSNWAAPFAEQGGVSGFNTNARSVAVDAGGNTFYVTGYTAGDLAGVQKTGTTDAFLTKYVTSPSTTTVSTRLLGVAGAVTQGNSVAVDGGGNVYVAGYTAGDLAGIQKAGTNDAFFTKYDSVGNSTTRLLGVANGDTRATSVAVNASGTVVYVAGYTTGALGIKPGGQSNTRTGTTDAFITKYDISDGSVYTQLLGVSTADTRATAVAVDTDGNVFLAGYTDGGLNGAPTGTSDFFVAKYNSSFVQQ